LWPGESTAHALFLGTPGDGALLRRLTGACAYGVPHSGSNRITNRRRGVKNGVWHARDGHHTFSNFEGAHLR
jgi:hypothetical protein